jgi:DNA end-binding protein Ku
LRAETLRFAEELRTPELIGLPSPEEPSAQKVKALRGAIAKKSAAALPKRELADRYWRELEALVAKKRKRHEDVVKPAPGEHEEENLAEVIDLVAILRKSLGQTADAPAPTRSKPAKPDASEHGSRAPARKKAGRSSAAPKRASATAKKTPRAAPKRAAKRAKHGR